MPTQALDFLTVICQRKDEKKVIEAALKAGAPGATSLHGMGTGVRQKLGLAGQLVEAEKAVLLLALPESLTPAVVKAINEAASLHKAGNGFIAVQKAQQILGYI